MYHACAFGTSEETVAWDASSAVHTAGGAVLEPLKAGARLRIAVAPTTDSPNTSPEQYLQGLASQMDAFERDVKVSELEPLHHRRKGVVHPNLGGDASRCRDSGKQSTCCDSSRRLGL